MDCGPNPPPSASTKGTDLHRCGSWRSHVGGGAELDGDVAGEIGILLRQQGGSSGTFIGCESPSCPIGGGSLYMRYQTICPAVCKTV